MTRAPARWVTPVGAISKLSLLKMTLASPRLRRRRVGVWSAKTLMSLSIVGRRVSVQCERFCGAPLVKRQVGGGASPSTTEDEADD